MNYIHNASFQTLQHSSFTRVCQSHLTLCCFVLEGALKWSGNRIQVLWDVTLRLRIVVLDESKERIAFVFKGQEVIEGVLLGLVVHVARVG